jgi:hypothetical protein
MNLIKGAIILLDLIFIYVMIEQGIKEKKYSHITIIINALFIADIIILIFKL